MTDIAGQVEWRMRVADWVASFFRRQPKIHAIIVGGSVGRGFADEFSDLDLGVFWHETPTVKERRVIAATIGVEQLTEIKPFETQPKKASGTEDNFLVHGFQVDVCHQLARTVDQWIYDVCLAGDRSSYKHALLGVLQGAESIFGDQVLKSWQDQSRFPEETRRKIVVEQLRYFFNSNVPILIDRHETSVFYSYLNSIHKRMVMALLAINRRFFIGLRHLDRQLANLPLVPKDFGERMSGCHGVELSVAWAATRDMIEDVVAIIQKEFSDINIQGIRSENSYARSTWQTPPAELAKHLLSHT